MNIKHLKEYFENCEKPKFFLVDVFSWRGSYNEVAFKPSLVGSKEESLLMIGRALIEKFDGYKGGVYEYNLYTTVHFECEHSCCNDNLLYDMLLGLKEE